MIISPLSFNIKLANELCYVETVNKISNRNWNRYCKNSRNARVFFCYNKNLHPITYVNNSFVDHCSQETLRLLSSTPIRDDNALHLFATKEEVEHFNKEKVMSWPGEGYVYVGRVMIEEN